ncbi:unnamed protein product [Thelazia callipaeda]|uniref:Serine/threonine-protein phosphatase n=1 Tax=Thelazia callipaeda TaxID=103827 RepID=A0A0N5CVW1_THECL|nr:unnamed protein product [Thelazia callipaeda]
MRLLENIYRRYGCYLAKRPLPFLVIPVIITVISSFGLLRFHANDDIRHLFSPINGLTRVEEKGLERFEYASASHHYRIQILVSRKDGGNLMNDENLAEILEMHQYVNNNITIHDGFNVLTYTNICGIYCNDSNNIAIAFIQAVIDTKSQSSSLVFTYPNARALQNRVFLGYSVGETHQSTEDATTVVDSFKLFILHFMVNLELPNGDTIAKNFESQLRAFFESSSITSQNLDYKLTSFDRETEEQRRITLTALPFLVVTISVLTVFMVISLINFSPVKSQHIEAFFAVISPIMAMITSMGFLWGFNVPFSNILTVVPFLILAIGVDDSFLILAAWRHSNPDSDLCTRIGETLAYSGASFTVTSLTDVLCFGVGLFSNLPIVRLFCLYACTALMFDFVYQITFYTAVVVYCNRRKLNLANDRKYCDQKSKCESVVDAFWRKIDQENLNKVCIGEIGTIKYSLSNSNSWPAKIPKRTYKNTQTFLQRFIGFLHIPLVKFCVITLFIIHIIATVYLCTKVNSNFDLENLYLKNSPMKEIAQRIQHFVLGESYVVNFGLYPMPNFADPSIRDKFNNLIEELEAIPKFGLGRVGTVLWTRDFDDAAAFWGEEDDLWTEDRLLSAFREYGMEDKFITTKRRADGTEVISGFYWIITYHNMRDFTDVAELMFLRRSILANYSKFFTISSHHPLEKVPTESSASAVIDERKRKLPERYTQPISIIVGSDTNIKDQSISCSRKINPVISNMDLNADARTRLLITLNDVGLPVIQSGCSNLLAMLPITMVHAYVVAVFWKTIVLVTILGLAHALILLPVMFIVIDDVKFHNKPSLLEVEVPCVVIGDIHGQYEDLHRIFTVLGEGRISGAVKRRFVFLGDYVDRGLHSLETICCLLAYKLIFPKMFNMLRGNHESADINQAYGFQAELERRFPHNNESSTLWNAFNELFACMPLSAIIHNKILCMHGGIGPELKSLDDIRKIKRPLNDPIDSPLACSLLWSDPMLDLKGFIKNSIRGAGYFFGEDTVNTCCEQLNIDLIVRAHQLIMNGYGFFCKRRMVSLFSAPRYLSCKNNKCAIMRVEKDLRVGFVLLCPVTPETQGKL